MPDERLAAFNALAVGFSRLDTNVSGKPFESFLKLVEKLHPKDQLTGARSVLKMSKTLPGNLRAGALVKLSAEISKVRDTNRPALFDEIVLAANDKGYPVGASEKSALLNALIGQLHSLAESGQNKRFRELGQAIAALKSDGAAVTETWLSSILSLKMGARFEAFSDAWKHAENFGDATTTQSLLGKIVWLPDEKIGTVFDKLLVKPQDLTDAYDKLFEGAKSAMSSSRPRQLNIVSALLGKIPPDQRLVNAQAMFDFIETTNAIERSLPLRTLAGQVKTLPESGRSAFYDSLVKAAGKLGTSDKDAVLMSLASQIKYLPNDSRLTAFDNMIAWARKLNATDKTKSIGLLLEQAGSLPATKIVESFELCRTIDSGLSIRKAFNSTVKGVAELSEDEQLDRIDGLVSLLKKLPETERFSACVQLWNGVGAVPSVSKHQIRNELFSYDPTVNLPVETAAETIARNVSDRNTSFVKYREEARSLAAEHRTAAMELLVESTLILGVDDRALQLAWLASSIDRLPMEARNRTFGNLLSQVRDLDENRRAPALRELGSELASLAEPDRYIRFDEILKEIEKLPVAHRGYPALRLIERLPVIPANSRHGAFESLQKSIRLLPETDKHACLTQLIRRIAYLPEINRSSVFDEALVDARKITVGEPHVLFDALLMQLPELPPDKQIEAFKGCIPFTKSTRLISIKKFVPFQLRWGPRYRPNWPMRIPAHYTYTDALQTNWLTSGGANYYINNLVLQLALVAPENRMKLFDVVMKEISLMDPVPSRALPLAISGLIVESLKESDQAEAVKSILSRLKSLKVDERMNVCVSLAPFIAESQVAQLLLTMAEDAQKLGVNDRLEAIEAIVQSLPRVNDKVELLSVAKKLIDCFASLTDAQIRAADMPALRGTMWEALKAIETADLVALKLVDPRFPDDESVVIAPVESVSPVTALPKFGTVFTHVADPLPELDREGRAADDTGESPNTPAKSNSGPAKSATTMVTDVPKSVGGRVMKIEGSRHEFAPMKPGSDMAFLVPDIQAPRVFPTPDALPVLPANMPKTVYLSDTRSPVEIGKDGFKAKGHNASFETHATGNRKDSAFVSVSRSADKAASYAFDKSGADQLVHTYLYEIEAPATANALANWYDVGERYPESAEFEYGVKDGIAADRIVRVHLIERNASGMPDDFTILESYDRRAVA